ncbi:MAG: hypothetical protein IJG84_00965 [Kiritimatiellae bacterium]|nr:hypothetical protein [Kiritimatiellia bacterium]
MRTRIGTILIAVVALAVGAGAGWLAAQLGKCENVEVCKYGNMETANAVDKPRRKALIRSSADAEVQKRILENKISYLEKCIAAAKVSDAKPAEKKARDKRRDSRAADESADG